MNATPVILIDGTAWLYRAFYALPPLSTKDGRPTGAVRGVAAMLRRLRKDYPDSEIVMIMDAPGGTFRDEIYAEYKSHRPPMPPEMRQQIEPLQELTRAMGFPLMIIDNVEADDVIGTLSVQAGAAQRQVLISTSDKDLAQLVNERVRLFDTMKSTMLDAEGVEQKFGVPPSLMLDYLSLVGDSSDNIPGVAGIGPKTAQALISHLGGLDAIYADTAKAAEVPVRGASGLPKKLEQGRETAWLSRRLAEIRTDVELEFDLQSLPPFKPRPEEMLALFEELEFRGWFKELQAEMRNSSGTAKNAAPQDSEARSATPPDADADPGGAGEKTASGSILPEPPLQTQTRWELVLEPQQLQAWVQRLEQAEIFCIDVETTDLDVMRARIVGVSVAVTPGEAAYIPFGHDYEGAPGQLDEKQVLGALKPLLEDPARAKLGQNLKYDCNALANHGIHLRGIARDTMLESYVLDSAVGQHHALDRLARRHLERETIQFTDVAGKGAKQLRFNQVHLEQAAPYAAEDADVALQLDAVFYPQLQKTPRLHRLFEEMEMPLLGVLAHMERNGTLVDPELLHSHSKELERKIAGLEQRAWKIAGREFNLNSTKQLQEILYEEQGLSITHRTPGGKASTNEAALQDLVHQHPLPGLLLEYRQLDKLKSTYTDRLPQQLNPGTGRVHTSWHQAVTSTGRLSSSDPNLQNIPIRSEEGRRIRRAFIAPEGWRILAVDYSQIELRIMAHLSGDQNLLDAFQRGEDIHRATAAEVFGVPSLDAVSTQQRQNAKAINFGLIYGMSAFGLARNLDIDHRDAQDYIKRYFARYPAVREYMQRAPADARQRGYVSTLFGRRLHLPDIRSSNQGRRRLAERISINAPMQGTAADIIKRAMITLDQWLRTANAPARLIIQVHDELVLEVREDALQEVQGEVGRIMSAAAELTVPLVVDSGSGNNWDEAH